MIEMLASDACVAKVADQLGVDVKTVRLWRDRFLVGGIRGLRKIGAELNAKNVSRA